MKKVFRLANAEFNKIFLRPSIFILTAFLIVSLIVSNVLLNGRNKDELVLLVHEKEQTVEALDGIIMILKERGYKILPITEEKEAMNFWNKNL